MKRLMFVLSGEHPTLPASEVTAAIRAERHACKVHERLDQLLVVETKTEPEVLASRLAMCREICSHLCTANTGEILDAVGSSDILDLLPHGKTFAVRVRRVKRYSPEINVLDLSKRIADMILSEVEFRVDLVNPEIEILGMLTDDKCALGLTLAKVDRSKFAERRPTLREVFHPGTLMPVMARCMVNLARTPRGGTLLDPFSGVGGILIEAGMIGAKPIGVDIDKRMIDGARRNLEACGVKEYQLIVGDARKLPALEVDAVATDPPYGRQTTTAGLELKELYEQALPSIAGALKRRGYACITSPAGLELKEIASGAGLRMVELHEQRVHKTLTRRIYVFKRE